MAGDQRRILQELLLIVVIGLGEVLLLTGIFAIAVTFLRPAKDAD